MKGHQAEDAIRNRVEESGLITINLDDFHPKQAARAFDLSSYLEQGLILKERPFRLAIQSLKPEDWQGRVVALHCSSDAILPDWAWMLATSSLTSLGAEVHIGTVSEVNEVLLIRALEQMDVLPYQDAKVVIKGCSSGTTASGLACVIRRLQPIVQSLMYGEPCSTVPVYKRPKN